MKNNIFRTLSGNKELKVEIKKPVVEKMQQQAIRDIVFIKMLSGGR